MSNVVFEEVLSVEAQKLRGEVEKFRDAHAVETMAILFEKIPAKIIYLSNLIKNTSPFNVYNVEELPHGVKTVENDPSGRKRQASHEMSDDPSRSKITVTDEFFTSNQQIEEMYSIVKAESTWLGEYTRTIKVWVELNVPRVEDGNNFGVDIQHNIIDELANYEATIINLMDNGTKYYTARGKLTSKIIKCPTIEDYRKGVSELDQKQYCTLRNVLITNRDHYIVIYDTILKNFDRLKRPRSGHAVNMY